jgi:hypothetical protein
MPRSNLDFFAADLFSSRCDVQHGRVLQFAQGPPAGTPKCWPKQMIAAATNSTRMRQGCNLCSHNHPRSLPFPIPLLTFASELPHFHVGKFFQARRRAA